MVVTIKFILRTLYISSILLSLNFNCYAFENTVLPQQWATLDPIIQSRINQMTPKMKLGREQALSFVHFLEKKSVNDFPQLQELQKQLPKTTLELLIAIQSRSQDKYEAEKMADYLRHLVDEFQFKNVGAFDENTSHIIGREWSEIDYSGEGMTWQGQKAKYKAYGITNFKTVACLKKFFPVESRLPYFNKSYLPQKNPAL